MSCRLVFSCIFSCHVFSSLFLLFDVLFFRQVLAQAHLLLQQAIGAVFWLLSFKIICVADLEVILVELKKPVLTDQMHFKCEITLLRPMLFQAVAAF